MKYKTLSELGISLAHPESLEWRHPWKEDFKRGILKGMKFRMGRKLSTAKDYLHPCLDADWVSNNKPAVIYYKYGTLEAKATFFQLPTCKYKTPTNIKTELLTKYPGSTIDIPRVGCQLHGDIDATLQLSDGTVYSIPWNY